MNTRTKDNKPMKSSIVRVWMSEDPYLTHALYQLVTRAGQYTNMSMVRYLIISGGVDVNSRTIRKPHHILPPGTYHVKVGPRVYHMKLEQSAVE